MTRSVVVTFPDSRASCAGCATGRDVPDADGPDWLGGHTDTGCSLHVTRWVTLARPRSPKVTLKARLIVANETLSPLLMTAVSAVRRPGGLGPSPVQRAAMTRLGALVLDGMATDETTLMWALAGFDTSALVTRASAAGQSAGAAVAYMIYLRGADDPEGHPLDPSAQEMVAWVEAGQDMQEAGQWMSAAVRLPDQRPLPMTPRDLWRLWDVGLRSQDPAWAGVAQVCPQLVAEALDRGRGPREIVALFRAVPVQMGPTGACPFPSMSGCDWTGEGVTAGRQVADLAADLNWLDLADCLRAGMDIETAVEHVRSGAEMDPVRLLSALA